MDCSKCSKRETCIELCKEAEEYVSQDYIPSMGEIPLPMKRLEYLAMNSLFSLSDLVSSKDVWNYRLDVTEDDLERLYDKIKLTEKQKEVMRLRVRIGKHRQSQETIAKKLGIIPQAIAKRLEFCQKKLRKLLKTTM